jgi:hypothetical protein
VAEGKRESEKEKIWRSEDEKILICEGKKI